MICNLRHPVHIRHPVIQVGKQKFGSIWLHLWLHMSGTLKQFWPQNCFEAGAKILCGEKTASKQFCAAKNEDNEEQRWIDMNVQINSCLIFFYTNSNTLIFQAPPKEFLKAVLCGEKLPDFENTLNGKTYRSWVRQIWYTMFEFFFNLSFLIWFLDLISPCVWDFFIPIFLRGCKSVGSNLFMRVQMCLVIYVGILESPVKLQAKYTGRMYNGCFCNASATQLHCWSWAMHYFFESRTIYTGHALHTLFSNDIYQSRTLHDVRTGRMYYRRFCHAAALFMSHTLHIWVSNYVHESRTIHDVYIL